MPRPSSGISGRHMVVNFSTSLPPLREKPVVSQPRCVVLLASLLPSMLPHRLKDSALGCPLSQPEDKRRSARAMSRSAKVKRRHSRRLEVTLWVLCTVLGCPLSQPVSLHLPLLREALLFG